MYNDNRGADEYRTLFNTNVVGTSDVTQALLPLLRKGNTRRIINITSLLGSLSFTTPVPFVPSVCINVYILYKN